MFLYKYGIKLYIRDAFSNQSACGVEDSVENYQPYLISCCAVMVFKSYGILFFRFVTHISISVMINILNYAFAHILFSLCIVPLAAEMSERQAF